MLVSRHVTRLLLLSVLCVCPDQLQLPNPPAPSLVEAHLGPQVHISRLHPSASRDSRWLSGPAGRVTLLEYTCAAGCSGPALPVSFRASAARLQSSADVELTLRVRLLAAQERRAPSLGVQFRPPAGTSAVSAICTGDGGGVVRFDRQAALVAWTVRELSGQQEATAVLRVSWGRRGVYCVGGWNGCRCVFCLGPIN